jgi:hypothetical protein
MNPLERYKARHKASAAEDPRPKFHEKRLQRLGLTEKEFDDAVTSEINERIRQARAESALERIENAAPTVPRILSKEDCMTLFHATGVPTSGSLLGVYWWAADLFQTRLNFDIDFSPEQIEWLNAYD